MNDEVVLAWALVEWENEDTWIAAYTHNFPSIDLADVELVHLGGMVLGDEAVNDNSNSDSDLSEPPLSECELPPTRAPIGRPSNKRERKGDGRSLRNLRRRLENQGHCQTFLTERLHAARLVHKNLGHFASDYRVLFHTPEWRTATLYSAGAGCKIFISFGGSLHIFQQG